MLLMMERIGHALGNDFREQEDDGKESHDETPHFASRPQSDMQAVQFGAGTRGPIGGGAAFVGSSSPSDYSGKIAVRFGTDPFSTDLLPETMKSALPPSATRTVRPFPMPDIYSRSPGMSRPTLNMSVLQTNTSPMQYPTERAVPSSAGMRRLDPSMYLTQSPLHDPEKTSHKDAELDMNLPFPVKLHYILSNPKYQDCVAWLPHGRGWRILKPKAFEKRLIPKFFRSAKYASFMRQVNGWAFTRITEGPDLNAYYHEMFLRGIPELSLKMKRPPKVKNAASAARNAAGAATGTPDFYRIEKFAPLPPSAPFKPVVQVTNAVSPGVEATPRYLIQPLNAEGKVDELEDISVAEGVADDEQVVAIVSSTPFVDPFQDEIFGIGDIAKRRQGEVSNVGSVGEDASNNPHHVTSQGRRLSATSSSTPGAAPTSSSSAEEVAMDTTLTLSKADIHYLSHQNQILKSLFEQRTQTEELESNDD